MKPDKIWKKGRIGKDIEEVNRIMDEIKKTNEELEYVSETIFISNGEIVDKKNSAIMTLPSEKEVLRNM